jgi:hypothetical protein
MGHDYDLLVIGSGPTGCHSSREAPSQGRARRAPTPSRRRLCQHRNDPVEDDPRGRHVPAGLGGTVDFLVESVFNYPTLAEAYKVAALDAANELRAVRQLAG